MKNCLNCGLETKNPKFCSRSCSASINNKGVIRNKSTKNYFCKICNTTIAPRQKRCNDCKLKVKGNDGKYYNANEITKDLVSTTDTQKYRRIRDQARKIAKQAGLIQTCFKCNYFIHVECAHKNGIETFSDNTLLSDINCIENLIGFCRNCHWEFDNHLFTI
jgi:ribosomal protein L37AE/L43A